MELYIQNRECMYLVIYSFVTNSYTAPSDWMAMYNGPEIIQGDSAGNISSLGDDPIGHCEKKFGWLRK